MYFDTHDEAMEFYEEMADQGFFPLLPKQVPEGWWVALQEPENEEN